MSPSPLVLASASPRRRELLAGLGLELVVRPVDIDETPRAGETPTELVLRLAGEKARQAADDGEVVLAADTVVVLDSDVLGKPRDEAEAREMLSRLAGREHTVWTGVAVVSAGPPTVEALSADSTRVRIATLGRERIAWYVETGEPMDKAGAYAIQGLGATFVESIDGNYTNVVGLPLPTVYRLLHELGYDLFDFRS